MNRARKKEMAASIRKAALVIFITCLIWVWADLSLDEDLAGQVITIQASRANPKLWVTIDGKTEVQIKADLTGPRGKINELLAKLNSEKEKFEIVFDAEKANMTSGGEYDLDDLRKFVSESKKIRDYGLAVKATSPNKLKIEVAELKERTLKVVCVDETDAEIAGATIIPETINMPVPDELEEVRVKLTMLSEKKQARQGFIDKKPYIELSGVTRYADSSVRVELPAVQDDMKQHTIRGTLGYILSGNLADGKYKIEFIKRPDIGSLTIIATTEAKAAYEAKAFEVLLEISDDDFKAGEITRKVIYNFPIQYVREDKIQLKGEPAEAKFKLIAVDEVAETP